MQCVGPDTGIEVYDTTSSDGATFAGTSESFTIDLSGATPTLTAGATIAVSESDPPGGHAFEALSRFRCDGLAAIP